MNENDSDLLYTCSLIEYIGRECRQKRRYVAEKLGIETLKRIYRCADKFQSEPIAKIADDYIKLSGLSCGNYDNVAECKYEVPDYRTIGNVCSRLIEDVCEDDMVETLTFIYSSWISDAISNYNTDFFYQSREYIAHCFKENTIVS